MVVGDWLFTCNMNPQQFSHTLSNGDFVTIEGSTHSKQHCGCKPISTSYAKWFIDNEISKAYDDLNFFRKLTPFKRVEKYHYTRTYGDLTLHYYGKKPLKKLRQTPSSYQRRFYKRWLVYKGIEIELTDKYVLFDVYETWVKKKCEQDGIEFEGI